MEEAQYVNQKTTINFRFKFRTINIQKQKGVGTNIKIKPNFYKITINIIWAIEIQEVLHYYTL